MYSPLGLDGLDGSPRSMGGPSLLGTATGLPPRTLEESINMLDGQAGRLGDREEDVEERHGTPGCEENERAPGVHAFEDRGRGTVDAEVEQPVEALGESRPK